MYLDLVSVYGKLDTDTPECVLLELLQRIGHPYYLTLATCNKMDRKMIANDVLSILNRPHEIKTLDQGNIFISIKCNFKIAQEYMIFLTGGFKEYFKEHDYIYTDPTPANYKTMTPLLMYSIGLSRNIPFSYNDTPYDMIKKLDASRSTVVSKEKLSILCDKLHQITFLQNMINPTTDEGAISLAFILYNCNIIDSINPIQCFNIIKEHVIKNKNTLGLTFKENSKFAINYNTNPSYYDVHCRFSSSFPLDFYKKDHLQYLCEINGLYYSDNLEEMYKCLEEHYKHFTFYQGIVPFIENKETCVDLIDIKEAKDVFSYGNGKEGIFITVEELIKTFENYKNFVNPFMKDSVFTSNDIYILKRLLIYEDNHTMDVSDNKLRLKLLKVINEIELKNDTDELSKVLDSYKEDPIRLEKLHYLLDKILNISLYIRGWDGIGTKPYYECPIIESEKMEKLEYNLSNLFMELKEEEDFDIYHDLPLFIYKGGSFLKNHDPDLGITLGDRINIILEGSITDNENSCIRASSNYFCWNIYYYKLLLGCELPFEIQRLRYIS